MTTSTVTASTVTTSTVTTSTVTTSPVHVTSASGARAILVRDDSRPLVATSLRFSAGAAQDPAGRSGLAHLLEHLMFGGTRRFGRNGHIKMIQSMGGYANATTSADWTRHYHVVPPELLPIFLELEAERLVDAPAMMTDAAVRQEQDVVLGERRQRIDSAPYGEATETLLAALYPPDSPYHRMPIGSATDVRRLELADCRAFHAGYYTGARANLAIVGDVRPEELAGPVTALLDVLGAGAMPTADGQSPASARLDQCLPAQPRRIELTSSLKPKVFLGCLLPPSASWDFELARFAGLFLGRGLSARLPDRLVRRDQVASAVTVKTMARAAGASVGIIEIVPVDGVGAGEVIARCDAALADVVAGLLDAAELARTKAVYRSSWLADDDTFTGRSDSLSLAMQQDGTAASYFGHDARISEVTLDELRGAAGSWHQPGHRVELIYQP